MIVVLGAPLVVLFFHSPIAQDQAYHAFAGDGTAAIPNLWNVVSNLPFLLVGIAGFIHCRTRGAGKAGEATARDAWSVFFGGTALVAFGSAYYHWNPNDATLVWDRLPMTVAFMGLFVALMTEYVDRRAERALLVPAIVVGVASVAWWHYSGDLRVYLGVQFGPLLAIPVILALFPPRFTLGRYLVYGLVCYVLAKLAETYDREIFEFTAGRISLPIGGHPLKHLLAAAAPLCIWLMLWRRRAIGSG